MNRGAGGRAGVPGVGQEAWGRMGGPGAGQGVLMQDRGA